MDFHNLITRYRQFGGFRLLLAYVRDGLLLTVLGQGCCLLVGRKSRDEAYAAVRRKINVILQRRYVAFIQNRKAFYDHRDLHQQCSKKVWICWLQGFETAPLLVKTCLASIRKNLTDREIVQLSYHNYQEYVGLPQYVVEKYEKGVIPPALFSDLLRLEVLIKYGGTWMDATMLCTGDSDSVEIMNCDLFMFQSVTKDAVKFRGASNWFITSCSENRLLMVLRDVLLQYWKDYDVTLNYYMFHDFFYTIAQLYPTEIAAMPRRNRLWPLQLMGRIGDEYDEQWWKQLQTRCSFHKLNYRLNKNEESNTMNFYHAIIEEYS